MQFGQIDGGTTDMTKQDRSFAIRDNLVENTGFDYRDTAAIAGFYVADLVAERNEIASVPHCGISVGWGCGKEPPGLSELWQAGARSNGGLAVQRAQDLFYILNWSIWLGLYVIVETPSAVFGKRDAR